MDHSFIKKSFPKTTGRETFGRKYAKKILNWAESYNLNKFDFIATITAYTALSIVDAYQRNINEDIDQIIISGGGSYNKTLVRMIKKYCHEKFSKIIEVSIMEEIGYSSEAKEAIAFAILAYQTIKGIYNNVPNATGAKKAVILGDITPGRSFKFEA